MARKDTTTTTKPAKAPTQPVAKTAKPAAKAPGANASAKAAPPSARGGVKAAPAKAKAAAPPPKPVTLKHLAAGLSERRGLPKRDAEAFAADLVGDLVAQVKTDAKVRIAGLGVLEIRNRPAWTARNPATGEPVQVSASRKLVFRAAKELKETI